MQTENVNDGSSIEKAIVVGSTEGSGPRVITDTIAQMFGGHDGDYFIQQEVTTENKRLKKTFRIVQVEDSKGVNHMVYFDITSW